MAEVNYVNPASFLPQTGYRPQGPLAGALLNRQINDYEQIMGVQHQLQNIGLQEQAMKFGEFQQEAPLRSQLRQNKMTTAQAEAPFLAQLAQSGAQHTLAKQGHEMATTLSPQNREQFFTDLRNKNQGENWTKIQREMEIGFQIANEAKMLAQKNGQMAAMAHVQRKVRQAKEAGIDLPEELFMDPRSWDVFIRAGIESKKFLQQSEIQEQKDDAAYERADLTNEGRLGAANINAQSRIAAARIAASAKEASSGNKEPKPLSENQEIPTIRDRITRRKQQGLPDDPALMNQLSDAVERAWDRYEKDNIPDATKRRMMSDKPEVSAKAKAEYQARRNEFLSRHGVKEKRVDDTIKDPKPRRSLDSFN